MLDCLIALMKWLLAMVYYEMKQTALVAKFISQYLLKVKAGYVTMFPVRILGMGLSSARNADDVTVALLINNVELPDCRVSHYR